MDRLTPEQRRKNMQHVKSKDTSIEIALRKALWHAGIRYRKNFKELPGKPDIAITKYKIAIFCDSSFWHGRDFETKKKPETNKEFWEKKIRRNMERDNEVNKQLQAMEWTVLRFWDTEINKNIEDCINTVYEKILEIKLCQEEPLEVSDE